MWKYKKHFRAEKPETIGETDLNFDLGNYTEWLEEKIRNQQKLIGDIIESIENEDIIIQDNTENESLETMAQYFYQKLKKLYIP